MLILFLQISNENSRTKIKNLTQGFKSRLGTTEEMTHKHEYRPEENIQTPLQQDKKFKKHGKEPER